MPTSVIPYIPETIVVHLGAPTASAANVTVPFTDYVKNVVSSEIYPTWEPAALEANTLAIISFALNRYYTEYYRSRGYNFDITSSTAIDQKYIEGRNIYENISVLVDEIFDRYLRREGFVEPLAAKFCNGVTTTCEGLSQWGSQYLAEGGADAFSILRSYYGNIELVTNAPIQEPSPSYPGTPLRRGDTNADVALVQFMLNRISQNYPAIPKLTVDGVFGAATEESVRAFQSIFDLASDGVVGPATWYQLVLLYVAVQRLSELRSLGQTYTRYNWELPEPLSVGDTGSRVTFLQYVLSVLAAFIPSIPAADITGTYTENTQEFGARLSGFCRAFAHRLQLTTRPGTPFTRSMPASGRRFCPMGSCFRSRRRMRRRQPLSLPPIRPPRRPPPSSRSRPPEKRHSAIPTHRDFCNIPPEALPPDSRTRRDPYDSAGGLHQPPPCAVCRRCCGCCQRFSRHF